MRKLLLYNTLIVVFGIPAIGDIDSLIGLPLKKFYLFSLVLFTFLTLLPSLVSSIQKKQMSTLSFVLIFFVLCCFSILFNVSLYDDPSQSIITLFTSLTIVYATIVLFPSSGEIWKILKYYFIGCIIGCITLYIQFFAPNLLPPLDADKDKLNSYISAFRFTIYGYDPNESGFMLLFGVIIGVYLYKRSKRWYYILFCIIQSMAIFLTASRTVFLAYILFFSFHLYKHISLNRLLLALAIYCIAFFSIPLIIPTEILDRYLNIDNEIKNGTMANRTIIWQAAITVFKEHPFFGIGYNLSPHYIGTLIGRDMNAHNVFLKIMLEFGFIGLLVFLISLSTMFCKAIKNHSMLSIELLLVLIMSFMTLSWIYTMPVCFFIILIYFINFRCREWRQLQ